MSEIKNLSVPLNIRRSNRAKNVIFRVIPEKGLEIVIPEWVSLEDVPGFVERKRGWIDMAVEKFRQRGISLIPKELELPETIHFQAMNYRYNIIRSKGGRGKLKALKNVDKLHLRGESWVPEEEIAVLKKFVAAEAKKFLVPELRKVSRELGLPFEKVAVRSQRRRWGSCSVKRNINLNCKLMFLPFDLVRHLFIHELCHTVHLNHSEKYWRKVSSFQPDFKEYEKRLSLASKFVPDWMNHI